MFSNRDPEVRKSLGSKFLKLSRKLWGVEGSRGKDKELKEEVINALKELREAPINYTSIIPKLISTLMNSTITLDFLRIYS